MKRLLMSTNFTLLCVRFFSVSVKLRHDEFRFRKNVIGSTYFSDSLALIMQFRTKSRYLPFSKSPTCDRAQQL